MPGRPRARSRRPQARLPWASAFIRRQVEAIDPAGDPAMVDRAPGRNAWPDDFNIGRIGKNAANHTVLSRWAVAHIEHVVLVHAGNPE